MAECPDHLVWLEKYINTQLDAIREGSEQRWAAHKDAHTLLDNALNLAREEVQKKLIEMNEVRRQINDERGVYLTRAEFIAVTERLEGMVLSVTKSADTTRTQLALLAALFIAAIPLIIYLLEP